MDQFSFFMPQLDPLNYLDQLIGLFLYLVIFYYTILRYLLPHTIMTFKVKEWVIHKVATYDFNLKEENLNSTLFCQIDWDPYIKDLIQHLEEARNVGYQLSTVEQYLLLDALHEMLIEESNASI